MFFLKSRLRVVLVVGALIGALTTQAFAQGNPFRDVPANSWAYQAIHKLAADGLIKGYPGGYFKGQRPLTRYEAAVLTERVVKTLEAELADPTQAAKVNTADIVAVRKLLDEFGGDIKNLQKDVAVLKRQVKKNTKAIKRAQFHLYSFLRAPGSYREQVSAYAPNGSALPAGQSLTGPNVIGTGGALPKFIADPSTGFNGDLANNASYPGHKSNSLQAGDYGHGTGYQVIRLVWKGKLDRRTSYGVRIEDRNYFSNLTQTTTSTGASSSNSGSYFNNQYMRLNYAFIKYKDPSGLYASVGRMVEADHPNALAFSGYFQGTEIGYSKGPATIFGVYSFNYSNGNVCGTNGLGCNTNVGGPYQTILAHADYKFTPRFDAAVNYDAGRGMSGETWFDPAYNPYAPAGSQSPSSPTYIACKPNECGAWVPASYPIVVGSVGASYKFSPELSVSAELLHRFGNAPSGGAWGDANAFWGKAFWGKTGPSRGNNYLEGGFISAGMNSTGQNTGITNTTNYDQFYFNNPNGHEIAYAGLHHWFSNNARVGLVVQEWNVKPGIDIPLGGGYYMSKDAGTSIFLQTLISF